MVIRTPAPLRASYPVHRTLTTRWFDNDIYAHLNNSVHYQLFDTVVNGHLLEHALLDLHKSETVFLVVESGCRYFGEIAFPDVVTAGLRVGRLGTSSIRYEVGLFRSDTQQAAAAGHFIHVNVNRQTRQPEPIAPRAKDVLARLVMSG
ncbi:MAG: acyl-CoA thioester hydrolase [Paracoccaceae bacterium]